jgi:2-haloacid dehalogenase/putative hydrolase of the HAD superfamily
MPNRFQPKAVLLDFFGTVVEEIHIPVKQICDGISALSPDIKEAEVVGYWARIFSDLCSQSYGDNFQFQKELEARSLQKALDHFKIPLDGRLLSQSICDYRAHPTLFPERRSVLANCRIPVCLVSNIDNVEIQSAFRYLNLYFDYVVTSEDCRSYKPRPEIFERALSILKLKAGDVLQVGDSYQGDIAGAAAIGARTLWINRRKRRSTDGGSQPDFTAADLTGLTEFLK